MLVGPAGRGEEAGWRRLAAVPTLASPEGWPGAALCGGKLTARRASEGAPALWAMEAGGAPAGCNGAAASPAAGAAVGEGGRGKAGIEVPARLAGGRWTVGLGAAIGRGCGAGSME